MCRVLSYWTRMLQVPMGLRERGSDCCYLDGMLRGIVFVLLCYSHYVMWRL